MTSTPPPARTLPIGAHVRVRQHPHIAAGVVTGLHTIARADGATVAMYRVQCGELETWISGARLRRDGRRAAP